MLTAIDHLVIVVTDLESAIADYTGLGFTVVRGGQHPIGSHNALIALADGAYLELIAFPEPEVVHPWRAALAKGGGLVDYSMQTDDLGGDIDALRRAGATISEPTPFRRIRPDGYQLSWLLAIAGASQMGVVPFLIRDETPRDERVPREHTHRNGAAGIRRLTVAVEDADKIGIIFAGVIGAAAAAIERPELGARGLRFIVGPHALEFLAPAAGSGAIANWLAARGPSPYAATLAAAPGEAGELDRGLAHGARLLLG